MKTYAIQYILALCVFLAIDAVWLSTVARSFYVAELGPLLRERPDFVAAFVFYLIFVAGLVYFVISPATGVAQSLVAGAIFGFVCYATYDLTNLATLKGFSLRMAIVDMIWGTVLAGSVSAVTVWLLQKTGWAG